MKGAVEVNTMNNIFTDLDAKTRRWMIVLAAAVCLADFMFVSSRLKQLDMERQVLDVAVQQQSLIQQSGLKFLVILRTTSFVNRQKEHGELLSLIEQSRKEFESHSAHLSKILPADEKKLVEEYWSHLIQFASSPTDKLPYNISNPTVSAIYRLLTQRDLTRLVHEKAAAIQQRYQDRLVSLVSEFFLMVVLNLIALGLCLWTIVRRPQKRMESQVDFLPADGQMSQAIRSFDWQNHPLGHPQGWPEPLQKSLSAALSSHLPMTVFWGESAMFFYNDASIPLLDKAIHAQALGRPGYEVWEENWNAIAPKVDEALTEGKATVAKDVRMLADRGRGVEEFYVTFAFSPIRGAAGTVDGVLCVCTETTEKFFERRQLATLRILAIEAAGARTLQEACESIMDALAGNASDVPFAMIYLADSDNDHFVYYAGKGLKPGHPLAPLIISREENAIWPLDKVIKSKKSCEVVTFEHGVTARTTHNGTSPASPSQAAILPITMFGEHGKRGMLIVGLNPLRPCDTLYKYFLNLLAAEISTCMANGMVSQVQHSVRNN